MNKASDRRDIPRSIFIVPVKISKTKNDKMHFFSGLTTDISLVGVGMESADKMSVGERFCYEIFLSNGKTVKTKGSIVWKNEKGTKIFYGVRFDRIGIFGKIRLMRNIRILGIQCIPMDN
jgi:acid phosphatase class B